MKLRCTLGLQHWLRSLTRNCSSAHPLVCVCVCVWQNESKWDLRNFWKRGMLKSHFNKCKAGNNGIKPYIGKKSVGSRNAKDLNFTEFLRWWQLPDEEGDSFVLKYEFLDDKTRPMQHLEKALFKVRVCVRRRESSSSSADPDFSFPHSHAHTHANTHTCPHLLWALHVKDW